MNIPADKSMLDCRNSTLNLVHSVVVDQDEALKRVGKFLVTNLDSRDYKSIVAFILILNGACFQNKNTLSGFLKRKSSICIATNALIKLFNYQFYIKYTKNKSHKSFLWKSTAKQKPFLVRKFQVSRSSNLSRK